MCILAHILKIIQIRLPKGLALQKNFGQWNTKVRQLKQGEVRYQGYVPLAKVWVADTTKYNFRINVSIIPTSVHFVHEY